MYGSNCSLLPVLFYLGFDLGRNRHSGGKSILSMCVCEPPGPFGRIFNKKNRVIVVHIEKEHIHILIYTAR